MNSVSNHRILVIEDDTAIRATLIDILEINNGVGTRSSPATNGQEGVDLASAATTAPSMPS